MVEDNVILFTYCTLIVSKAVCLSISVAEKHSRKIVGTHSHIFLEWPSFGNNLMASSIPTGRLLWNQNGALSGLIQQEFFYVLMRTISYVPFGMVFRVIFLLNSPFLPIMLNRNSIYLFIEKSFYTAFHLKYQSSIQ